ncbi:MAG: hypothetical protein ED559_13710 [Phycisphaera sp.]|nr:MAG: hypothetical protein ED559_13710 [Phycisphaera sp.]
MPDWAFHWAGYLIAIVAGILMMLALFRDRAKRRSRCRKCWYDLSELGEVPITCPECGKAHTKPRHLRKTRRHKRLAFVWLLLMVVGGYGMWVVPRVNERGWVGAVPTTLMIAAAPLVRNKHVKPGKSLHSVKQDFTNRLFHNGHGLVWDVGATYWSVVGTKVSFLTSAGVRDNNTVADTYFTVLLSRGYGTRAKLVEYAERGIFGGKTLSLSATPVYNADKEIIYVWVDSVDKAPSERRIKVLLARLGLQEEVRRPTQPFAQSVWQLDGSRVRYSSDPIGLANNDGVYGPTLVWLEAAGGQDLGCYEVTWEIWYDGYGYEPGDTLVFLDIHSWRRVSD